MATDGQIVEMEEYDVPVLLPTGSTRTARLRVEEHAHGETVLVSLIDQDRVLTQSGPECWSALGALRRTLELEGIRLLCYGASRNVHPSGMSRDMGIGAYAYRLEMGHAARTADIVSIFATGPDVIPATLAEQQDYLARWRQSLKR